MSVGVKVGNITISLPDGSAMEVSVEEAKELYMQLGFLFGSAPTITVNPTRLIPVQPELRPNWNYPPPAITTPSAPPERPLIWCDSTGMQ